MAELHHIYSRKQILPLPTMEDNLEVEFIAKVTKWAKTQPDIQMALLVGSHARGDARGSSDIDFVILTRQPWRHLKDPAWASELGTVERSVTENWGKLDSLRVWYSNGLEVEFGFAEGNWLNEPRDPGTSRVLEDGFRILFARTEPPRRSKIIVKTTARSFNWFLITGAFSFLSSCVQPPPTAAEIANPSSPLNHVVKGYGISPQGFPADYSQFPEFLEEVSAMPRGGVMFNGAWRDDVANGADAGQIPQSASAILDQSEAYGFVPIVVFGWRSDDGNVHIRVPSNPADDWSNAEAKGLFEQMLVELGERYHPPFVFLGNESDAHYVANPEAYAGWVEFYNRAYDAIKRVSPETQVGPIFQYERLSGQGTFNQWTTPQWGALDAHDLGRMDLIGITLYPWLSVATPSEIPDDYLSPLKERIDGKPIAITETGWPGENLGLETAWEASSKAQISYIAALDRMLADVDLRILNWLHLNQMSRPEGNQTFWQVFSSISLRDIEGNKRPVYDTWMNFSP